MNRLRPELPPLPENMRDLPVEERGYPVPYFVAYVDGKPDFRVMDAQKLRDAIRFRRCWLCGKSMGRHGTFAIGPMCAINRTSSEPPSHRECAEFAVHACPFLMRPGMSRREEGRPEGSVAGTMIMRNPGVMLLWGSRTWHTWGTEDAILFDVGEPLSVAWYREGRAATRAEVLASIEAGLPFLQDLAEKDNDPAASLAELARRKALAMALVPA